MAAERGAKRNWMWGEWVGHQRLPRQRWLGRTRALQCGNRAHCCREDVGNEGAGTALRPGQETSLCPEPPTLEGSSLQRSADSTSPCGVKCQEAKGAHPPRAHLSGAHSAKCGPQSEQHQHHPEAYQKCRHSAQLPNPLHVNRSLHFNKLPRGLLCILKIQKH